MNTMLLTYIFCFAVAMLIHELGHLLAARACGVGATIPPAPFDAVAALYIALRRSRPASTPATHSTTESR